MVLNQAFFSYLIKAILIILKIVVQTKEACREAGGNAFV